ncbi:hypothetical protein DL770_009353 [Monosporascus sp. CRB-9-2]|nr:hypothetical protein DL770_009353 [Monosporascus sp. CRB-9-2]
MLTSKDTIISASPQLLGASQDRFFGLHKSIRDRLANGDKVTSIYHSAIAYELFWTYVALGNMPSATRVVSHEKRLQINREDLVLQEVLDIVEELRVMKYIFQEQLQRSERLQTVLGLA